MSACNPALLLKKENGKTVTVTARGSDVAMIFWRKNNGVLLPLVMNRMEAKRLASMILEAAAEATP